MKSDAEYLQVNQARFDAISHEISRLLDAECSLELTMTAFDQPATLVHSSYTPEFFMALYDDQVSSETARKLSQDENRIRSESGIDLIQHAVVAASVYDAEIKGLLDEDGIAQGDPLSFDLATYRTDMITESVTTNEIIFDTLGNSDHANYWSLVNKSGAIVTRLSYMGIDGSGIHISHQEDPQHDEELTRWMKFLGPAYDRLDLVHAGLFRDESELDAKLHEVAELFEGTNKETSVISVLQEIRERGITMKNAFEMIHQFGLDLPPIELLDKTIAMLRSVD